MFGLFKNGSQKNEDVFFEKVKKALEIEGLFIDDIDEDGLIHVSKGDLELRISLDNVRKQYERDKNETYIKEFVKAVTTAFDPIPEWENAKRNIFLSLFPSDYDFGEFINYPITDKFHTVFIYSSDSKNLWVDYDQLKKWEISEVLLVATAYSNMESELSNTDLEIELIDHKKLIFFETENETLKSALLLTKTLKEKVINELGWPVYAVMPVRDFCYLFSEKDLEFFIDRLGSVVVDEFQKSGYPVTTEILKINDDGINAIGYYPVE